MKKTVFYLILALFFTGCAHNQMIAEVAPGMDRNDVLGTWGQPQKAKSFDNSCCLAQSEEEWYYFNNYLQPPKLSKMVVFENGVVDEVYVWN